MRLFVIGSLIAVMFISAASAELLTTANPIGQGKWGVLGAGLMDSNTNNNTSYGLTTIGGYIGYGVMDKLDVYLNVGSANVTGLPAGVSSSMTAIGLTGKYTIIDESAGMPAVAIGAGYKSLNATFTGGTSTGNQMLVGVGASKVMAPFVPYGGIDYRTNSSGGTTTSTQLDLTVGTAIAWSVQGAVFVEGTMQSITPNGGSAYSSNQIGLGVGYKI